MGNDFDHDPTAPDRLEELRTVRALIVEDHARVQLGFTNYLKLLGDNEINCKGEIGGDYAKQGAIYKANNTEIVYMSPAGGGLCRVRIL